MQCFVVKYADGTYATKRSQKGTWDNARKFDSFHAANALVQTNKENKQAFINNSMRYGYIEGISPEYFDCRVFEWHITEQEVPFT